MGIFEVEDINGKPFINYEHFLEYVKRQEKEIERLNNIIKEVREYIEEKMELSKECPKELLKILKGVDKE